MESQEERSIRIHVGGLGESVSRDDIVKIFSPMGSVGAVDFVRTKGRSFAYIDFCPSSPNSLSKLFSTYNGCVWRGGRLRLEKAKEHFMARLRREWDHEDDATCPPPPPPPPPQKNPSNSKPSSHLHIFFPALRKFKSLPFSGTGKHKYSFQHVQVPSSLPNYFCDCEEHSTTPTPQRNHVHDPKKHSVGIQEEELYIMNSVMNRLFGRENHTNSEQIGLLNNEDNNAGPNELDFEEDEGNLIINVVSSASNSLPLSRNWEQESVSRKRKSVSCGAKTSVQGSTAYDTEGLKRNGVHPSNKRQLTSREGDGGKAATHTEPENKQVLDVVADQSLVELSRSVSGAKQLTGSVYWSQKSSWKALVTSGGSSYFSVSSVLSGIASNEEEQPPLCDTDFTDMPIQENLDLMDSDFPSSTEGPAAKNVNKPRFQKPNPLRKSGNSAVADVNESNEFSACDPEGRAKTLANTKKASMVEAESPEAERSAISSATDPSSWKGSSKTFAVDFGRTLSVSGLLGSTENDHSVSENLSWADDVEKEKQNIGTKENVEDEFDKVDVGKGLLGASNKSTRGSSWLQKSSWTRLVNEKNSSFSITQLIPDRNFEKQKPREVDHGDAEKCSSDKSKKELKAGETTATGESPGQGMAVKKTYGVNRRTGETFTFMRNAFSLKEWANAKKALTGAQKSRGKDN